MSFIQVTGLLGTCNTIAAVLISIRKCYRAKKKIGAIVNHSLSSLENIKKEAPAVARFVETGGIGLRTFCAFVCKIINIEVDLLKIVEKAKEMKRIYRFCSAPETAAALDSISRKLSQMESEMRLWLPSLRSDAKTSVLLEAFEPLLDAAAEIIPHADRWKEKKQLVADARRVFGTHVLASTMNRLVSRGTESLYWLFMGNIFYEGVAPDVDVNHERSAFFFQKSISNGNAEAFAFLGRQYEHGQGVSEDKSKALELYRKGAELKDPECLYQMGRCFRDGSGIEKDGGMAFHYYKKAALAGHVGGGREKGYCLIMGIGTEVDLLKGAKYSKSAAEAGDERALCYIGYCILKGKGVVKNVKAGLALLKIAGSAGSIDALAQMGNCYRRGLGVEENEKKAFRLYKEAADKKDLYALACVGQCLVHGWGVVQNKMKGVGCLRKAAADGSWHAFNVLARLYRNGIGVKENKGKALVCFKRVAAAGCLTSNLFIGKMYRHGEGVEANIRKAIQHFEMFAKYESDDSHWNLGCIYESEEEYKDNNRALYHFRFAADLGNLKARKRAGEYFVRVTGPRKLRFTQKELHFFIQNIKMQFRRRNSTIQYLPAVHGLPSTATLDSTFPDFSDSGAEETSTTVGELGRNILVPAPYKGGNDADDYGNELEKLKRIEVNKSCVLELPAKKLAAIVAAHLVNYDVSMAREFHKIKTCLFKFFEGNLIRGAVLVDAEKEDVQEITDRMIDIICKNCSEESFPEKRISVKVLLTSFIGRIRSGADVAS